MRREFVGKRSKGFTPVPGGTYDIEIDDVEEKTSKAGHAQLVCKGHIVGGEEADRKVTLFYVITDKSLWRVEALLTATDVDFEWTDEDLANETGTLNFDPDDLVGAVVRLDCDVDEYQGKPKNNWSNERAPKTGKAAVAGKPAAAGKPDATKKPAATAGATRGRPAAVVAPAPDAEEDMFDEEEEEEEEEVVAPTPEPTRRRRRVG